MALARALAKRPKVLLLDEPLSALDRKLREATRQELKALQVRLGSTFVMVTHDQEEAMTMADRIAVMDHGRIVQVAGPRDLYEAPVNRQVAEFVGEVNILEARVLETDGFNMIADSAGDRVHLRSPRRHANPGDAVWIGLRPEKLVVGRTEPNQAANKVSGRISAIQYYGNATALTIGAVDGRRALKASIANITRDLADPFVVGDAVWLSWSADAGVLLRE